MCILSNWEKMIVKVKERKIKREIDWMSEREKGRESENERM